MKRRPDTPQKNGVAQPTVENKLKRGPGRPRKKGVAQPTIENKLKRGPGRPRKNKADLTTILKRQAGRPRKGKANQPRAELHRNYYSETERTVDYQMRTPFIAHLIESSPLHHRLAGHVTSAGSLRLKGHVRLTNRLKVKGHKCVQCGKYFSEASFLTRHVATVHKLKFDCNNCLKTFAYRNNFFRHFYTCQT